MSTDPDADTERITYSDSNFLGNAIGYAVSRAICDACAERDRVADSEPLPQCPCAELDPHG